MADELRFLSRPALTDPVLIAAFRGWNDGGQGASLAGGFLGRAWEAERFAEIDPEGFFDFQATRPHVSLVEGMTRKIDWPENTFLHAHLPGTSRDAVLLLGIEPNVRWRTFTELVIGVAEDLNAQLVVSLGSLLADVPHTALHRSPAAPATRSSSRRSGSRHHATKAPPGSLGCCTTPVARRSFRP